MRKHKENRRITKEQQRAKKVKEKQTKSKQTKEGWHKIQKKQQRKGEENYRYASKIKNNAKKNR